MAYIGKQPTVGNFVKLDAITTSATDTYNLTNGGIAYSPQSANHCIVSLNGVIQEPTSASNVGGFTISGSTIVFTSALTSNDVIDFILVLGDVLNIGTPSDGTVTFPKVTSNLITGATASTTLDTSDSLLIYDDSISALRKQTSAIFQTVKKITVNENITTQYSGLANGTHTLTDFNVTHTALSTSNKLAFLFSSGYYSTSGTNVGITEMYLNNGTSNVTQSIYYDYAGASVSGGIEKSIFAGYFNLTPASTNAITYTIRIVVYRPSGSSTVTVGSSGPPSRLICVEYI